MNWKRSGFAMAIVITMSVVLLGMVSVLYFNTRSQKNAQSIVSYQTHALAGAQAILKLAICKYRLLPSEYYTIETAPATQTTFFREAWLADFNSKFATSPAYVLCEKFGCDELGVSSFTRIVPTQIGLEYKRDFLKIEAYAVYKGKRRVLEQLVEIVTN